MILCCFKEVYDSPAIGGGKTECQNVKNDLFLVDTFATASLRTGDSVGAGAVSVSISSQVLVVGSKLSAALCTLPAALHLLPLGAREALRLRERAELRRCLGLGGAAGGMPADWAWSVHQRFLFSAANA